MSMSRIRRWIALATSAALASCAMQVDTHAPAATLKDAYARDFLVGVAVNDDTVAGKDPAAQALLLRQFNAITPENVMKAEALSPRRDVYDFARADAYVDFGDRHGLFVVGHTLVWHNQVPPWFFTDTQGNPNDRAMQIERLRTHIQAVAGRYAGRVRGWDVVNEVIDEDGSFRDIGWVKAVGDGDEVVRRAFAFAQRYAPDAELYYNDFNAERPSKRDGIVRLVKMLQAAGIRIDGVGIQAHWGLDYPSLADIDAAIDAYAALGIKVMITELDVDVLPLSKEGQIIGTALTQPQFQLPEFKRFLDPYARELPASVQQQLASRYADIFRLLHRKRDKIARVTFWGLHDGVSWKNDRPVPNRTNYPLLFDRQLQPKPAFSAVIDVARRN